MAVEDNYKVGHVVMITLSAAIGGFLFGFDSSVINGANVALKGYFNCNDMQLGLAVSLALIGAAIGAYFAGRLADKFGRVRCMLAAAVLLSIIAPIYIAETAPAHLRGRLGSMQQFAIVIGIFVALLSNYIIVRISGSASNTIMGIHSWKVMFWVEAIPAFLYGVAAWQLPESPRFLVSKGRMEEAQKVLSMIASVGIKEKAQEIEDSFKTHKPAKLSDLLETVDGKKRVAPIVWAGLSIAILQQLVGINVIFYYGSMLWQSVGFGESDAFLTSVISSAINLTMTIAAILLIDKIGRKPLLLIGSAGMTVTLGVLACCFLFGSDASGNLVGNSGILALLAANFYVAFFAATWGPVMWVMLGEMFNNRIRAVAIAICGLAQWGANFLVSWSFPVLVGKDGIGIGPTYLIYTTFAAISFVLVAKLVNETKGKKLEAM